jgi:hypothetical protein
MKIRPVGAESFHVDGRTDMTKLTAAFRNFANATKNDDARQVPATHISTIPSNLTYTDLSVTTAISSNMNLGLPGGKFEKLVTPTLLHVPPITTSSISLSCQ